MSELRARQSFADITREDVHGKPWKYVGYKGYANLISLDNDLFILRRFGALNARVALLLQDKIVELEAQLKELDARYSSKSAGDFDNGTFRGDLEDRSGLLDQIESALKRYNDFVIQQTSIRKLVPAPRRDVEHPRTWHKNHDFKAIETKEWQYLYETEDLVRIVPEDKTHMRRVVDNSPFFRTLSIWKKKKDGIPDYDQSSISHYSDKRLDNFASGIIVVLGTAMLMTPLWILQ